MVARTDTYSIRFPADPVQVALFRHGLDRWLQGLEWPAEERVDALLAISEACTNVVRHAYPFGVPGEVEVTGRLVLEPERRRLAVTVRDRGAWRPESGGGGYGLRTMRACMERVVIRHDQDGTVVTLISNAVPPIEAAEATESTRSVTSRPPG
ncbi:ATP-binding protein [Pseudonocardia lacus]|uniref:ATP-binding protein n=1 Tax=Pseudonocardia lacus TaxID=2835865 RepID=UPI001BDC1123|nr:ATP-binding protein [Pseudonocardia lacus]